MHLQHRVLLSADPSPTQHILRTRHSITDHLHLTVLQCSISNRMDGVWGQETLFGCGQLCIIHPHPSTYYYSLATKCLTYLHSNHLHTLLPQQVQHFIVKYRSSTNAASTQVCQIIKLVCRLHVKKTRIFLYFLTHSLISFTKLCSFF